MNRKKKKKKKKNIGWNKTTTRETGLPWKFNFPWKEDCGLGHLVLYRLRFYGMKSNMSFWKVEFLKADFFYRSKVLE